MIKKLFLLSLLFISVLPVSAQTWVRINQAGYLPDDIKVAVLISTGDTKGDFVVRDAMTDAEVLRGQGKAADASKWALKSAWRLHREPPIGRKGNRVLVTEKEIKILHLKDNKALIKEKCYWEKK